MTYMDKYPVRAWFQYYDEADRYQHTHPELVLIAMTGGYAVIDVK